MKRVHFHDGRAAWALNAVDARMLHAQIFDERTYAQAELHEGACVFDVGANIGLASTWLSEQRSGLRVFAFEPNPRAFAALARNRASMGDATVTLLQCAVSDVVGETELTWDVFASSMGRISEGVSKRVDPREWNRALAADLGVSELAARAIGWARRLATRREKVAVRTLSDVIAEHRVECIDLLKVDVEGVEARVLAGLSDADWAKVQQVVVETDDVVGLSATLRSRGFDVRVTQDAGRTYALLGLHTLFARRAVA